MVTDATSKPTAPRAAARLRRLLAGALTALALLVLAPAGALADGDEAAPAPGLEVVAVDPPADPPADPGPVDPPPVDEPPPPDPAPVDPPPVDPAPAPVDPPPPPPDPVPVDPAPVDPVPAPLDPAPAPDPGPAPGRVSERAAVPPATATPGELLPSIPPALPASEPSAAAEPTAAEDEAKPEPAVGEAAPARAFRTALARLGIAPLPSVADLRADAPAGSGACAPLAPVAVADPGGTTDAVVHEQAPARGELQGPPVPRGPPRPLDLPTAPVAAGASSGAATATATVAWVVELAGAPAIAPCCTAAVAATCVAGPAGTVAGCHAARAPPTA